MLSQLKDQHFSNVGFFSRIYNISSRKFKDTSNSLPFVCFQCNSEFCQRINKSLHDIMWTCELVLPILFDTRSCLRWIYQKKKILITICSLRISCNISSSENFIKLDPTVTDVAQTYIQINILFFLCIDCLWPKNV